MARIVEIRLDVEPVSALKSVMKQLEKLGLKAEVYKGKNKAAYGAEVRVWGDFKTVFEKVWTIKPIVEIMPGNARAGYYRA